MKAEFFLAALLCISAPAYPQAEINIEVDLSPQNFKPIKSTWERYFCKNYGTVRTPGMRTKTIREYDGPNIALPDGYPGANGYRREEVLHNFRNWRRPDARGFDENATELVDNRISAIYGAPAPRADGMLDTERARILLDSIYGYRPELVRNVYIQWGNEINGKHIGLPQMDINELLGMLEASGNVNWSHYNRPEDQQPFVENYFLPAVAVTRQVSRHLFGDERAIRMMTPSFANIYNPQFREWMYGILDFPVDAAKFPGLGARQTWETIDVLTVHYPFSRPDGARVMQEIWDRYGGRIGRLWVTEEYGRDTSGPAGLIDRGLRYFSWVAANDLDADQTRLCWWGIDQEYPGGKPVDAAIEMGDWLYGRKLRYRQFSVNGETIDVIRANGMPHPRYLLVFSAMPRLSKYRVILSGTEFPAAVRAVRYDVTTTPEELPLAIAAGGGKQNIGIEVNGNGPLLLYVGD